MGAGFIVLLIHFKQQSHMRSSEIGFPIFISGRHVGGSPSSAQYSSIDTIFPLRHRMNDTQWKEAERSSDRPLSQRQGDHLPGERFLFHRSISWVLAVCNYVFIHRKALICAVPVDHGVIGKIERISVLSCLNTAFMKPAQSNMVFTSIHIFTSENSYNL